MPVLDIRTVFIICVSFIFLYGIGMLAFARKVPASFNGLYLFAVVNFLIAIGISLVFLRGQINLFWSIIVGNSAMMLASNLTYHAHLQFIHYENKPVFLLTFLLICSISLLIVFTYYLPNSSNRLILINSFHCLQYSLIAWTTSRWQRQHQQTIYTPLVVIATVFVFIIAFRIITISFSTQIPPYALQGNFAHSLQSIILMLYIAALDFSVVLIATGQLVGKISELAYQDSLTTLYNRRGLDHILQKAAVVEKPLAVILCDIDHFKLINDRYGHHTGDSVIQTFAKLIKTSTRKTDICVRWGGEEFLIILPLSDEAEAIIVAEKIRVACEKQHFPEQPELRFTSSFGICLKKEPFSFEEVTHNADQALYQAKSEGRNQVCIF